MSIAGIAARRISHTFFITPTASSVWFTKSSSFCSTSCLASSVIVAISSSGFMLLPTPVFPFAFVASRLNLEFSTLLLALVANIKFVFRVVLHPAKNLDWICLSWAKRASPTCSDARAYFSRAVERGSSPAPVWVSFKSWEPAREARAIAWLNVLGWGFADGGAVKAV